MTTISDDLPEELKVLLRHWKAENDRLGEVHTLLRDFRKRNPLSKHDHPTSLFFVRHAQATHNLTHNFYESDPGLTLQGIDRASKACLPSNASKNWQRALATSSLAVVSPLSRAVATARIMLDGCEIPIKVLSQIAVLHIKKPPPECPTFPYFPCDIGPNKEDLAEQGLDVTELSAVYQKIPPIPSILTGEGMDALLDALKWLLEWFECNTSCSIIVFGHRSLLYALTGVNCKDCECLECIVHNGIVKLKE